PCASSASRSAVTVVTASHCGLAVYGPRVPRLTAITSCPASTSRGTRYVPMCPVAPMTTTRLIPACPSVARSARPILPRGARRWPALVLQADVELGHRAGDRLVAGVADLPPERDLGQRRGRRDLAQRHQDRSMALRPAVPDDSLWSRMTGPWLRHPATSPIRREARSE